MRLNDKGSSAKVGGLPAAPLGGGNGLAEPRASTPRLIVAFAVEGRPVPWSVSRYRGGKKPALVVWQTEVHWRAELAMEGRKPYEGLVMLDMKFQLIKRCGHPPDVRNLQKGTEDALQGAVYVNDRQVRDGPASLDFIAVGSEGVFIRAWAIDGSPAHPIGGSTS